MLVTTAIHRMMVMFIIGIIEKIKIHFCSLIRYLGLDEFHFLLEMNSRLVSFWHIFVFVLWIAEKIDWNDSLSEAQRCRIVETKVGASVTFLSSLIGYLVASYGLAISRPRGLVSSRRFLHAVALFPMNVPLASKPCGSKQFFRFRFFYFCLIFFFHQT